MKLKAGKPAGPNPHPLEVPGLKWDKPWAVGFGGLCSGKGLCAVQQGGGFRREFFILRIPPGWVRCSITNGMQMGVGLWPALAKRQRSEPGHTQPHTHARLRTSAQKGPAPHSLFERLCVVPIGTAKVRAPAASPQMRHQRSLSRNERASLRGRGACLRTGGGGEQNQRTKWKCVVTKHRVGMGAMRCRCLLARNERTGA